MSVMLVDLHVLPCTSRYALYAVNITVSILCLQFVSERSLWYQLCY